MKSILIVIMLLNATLTGNAAVSHKSTESQFLGKKDDFYTKLEENYGVKIVLDKTAELKVKRFPKGNYDFWQSLSIFLNENKLTILKYRNHSIEVEKGNAKYQAFGNGVFESDINATFDADNGDVLNGSLYGLYYDHESFSFEDVTISPDNEIIDSGKNFIRLANLKNNKCTITFKNTYWAIGCYPLVFHLKSGVNKKVSDFSVQISKEGKRFILKYFHEPKVRLNLISRLSQPRPISALNLSYSSRYYKENGCLAKYEIMTEEEAPLFRTDLILGQVYTSVKFSVEGEAISVERHKLCQTKINKIDPRANE